MSPDSAVPGSPADVLAELDALRRRTRAARHAHWLPLLLFGLLGAVALPFYVMAETPAEMVAPQQVPILARLGGDVLDDAVALGWYWLAALIAGYLVSLAWYRWRGQQVGLQSPVRGYVLAGLAGTVAALTLTLVLDVLYSNVSGPVHDLAVWFTSELMAVNSRGMFPHLVIGVGLAVLARLERSRALTVTVVLYVAVLVLVSVAFRVDAYAVVGLLGRFTFLVAALLPVVVLLAGGCAAALLRRRPA
ncbi:hypothetical protein [Catellatospora paridis]|uniref:hypothetical protein n=1 Tax=Catellatospora paridis TaxID=1617086 RepID=UPI0012D445C4|nr:hypothetical protein [Catellatospora paridis]